MNFPTYHNPSIANVDTSNIDENWLEYRYRGNSEDIQDALAHFGYEFHTDADAMDCLKDAAAANPEFLEWLYSLDPHMEAYAYVYNKRNGLPCPMVDMVDVPNASIGNANTPPLSTQSNCQTGDILCAMREMFTVRLTMPHLVIGGIILIGLILIFRPTAKSA